VALKSVLPGLEREEHHLAQERLKSVSRQRCVTYRGEARHLADSITNAAVQPFTPPSRRAPLRSASGETDDSPGTLSGNAMRITMPPSSRRIVSGRVHAGALLTC